ncbi:MAG: hypothetical protein WD988_05045 [Candidatus Curtissbacteria bacterium]
MILKVFIFWRISLLALTYIGSIVFPKIANGGIGAIGPGKTFDFLASWAQWDGGHFVGIARLGYFNPQEYAFFPLFPNLIRFVSTFTFGNLPLAGLLIANVAFLAFLAVFYKLVKNKYGGGVASTTIFTFLAFPTAFFGVAVYTEAVFLLFACLTLYFLESKKWLYAAIFSSAAGATRLVGIFLIIPFIWAYIKSVKKIDLKILLLPLSISGFILYSLYLYLKFGDPLYFSTVQSVWHRSYVNPISTIWSYITVSPFNKPFNDYLDVASTLGFLLILAFGFKRIPRSWWLFSLFAILLPASTGTLTSMPRYVLAAFPVFILMGIYLKDRTALKAITWGIFLTMQTALAILFVNGFWTA